jgi:glutathione synthase/RimK-type ligase-like ATP-grasp enzyme
MLVNYCWGYVSRREAFLAWAERTAERSVLVNPLPVLRWNSDKIYLADLAADGVPTVPTRFVKPGEAWAVPAEDYVIKPSVGSGGWWAARYAQSPPEAPDRHVAALHATGQTVLVQPYQRAVDNEGETALVFFGGQFSHAVHKAALLEADVGVTDALWEREVITPIGASEAHLNVARAAIASVAGQVGKTVYARVDVISGDGGSPLVAEVELIEPSLFLPTADTAAARFVQAMVDFRPT